MEETSKSETMTPSPELVRSWLKESDWRFLRLVMYGGGYFTRSQAVGLKLQASPDTTYRRLRWLERLRLVRQQAWVPDPRCPRLYKLTARALRLLGHVDSNIRRMHSPEAIQRKLLTVQFLSEHRDPQLRLALSPEKKAAFFESIGFLPELLPVRKRRGRPVLTCDEIVGTDGFCIYLYYIDHFTSSAETELRVWLTTYAPLIPSGRECLRFVLVVGTEEREQAYRKFIEQASKSYGIEITIQRVESWPLAAPRGAGVVPVVRPSVG